MADRRKLLRSWLYAMTRLEVQLRVTQGRSRNAMIKAAAKAYEETHHPPAHVFISHQARTRQNITDAYRRTVPVFADMALKQLPSAKSLRRRKSFDDLTQQWITREALRKARMIAATDREDVIDAISDGL